MNAKLEKILEDYTQRELADLLSITQWQLLIKMRDNSFTDDEIKSIDVIFDANVMN